MILILTGSVVSQVPGSPMLGGLAPILILTLMTWYLLILIVHRSEIMTALAAIFKLRRKTKPDETNVWLTIAVYATLIVLGIVALWTGLPQRILGRLQGMAILFGTENSSRPSSQSNPIAGILPVTPFLYYGLVVSAAILALSFVILLGGLSLALKTREVNPNDSELEMKMNAAEVVRQAITGLRTAKAYHETILQCYKLMCKVLSGAGIDVEPAETAREFAESISTRLELGKDAVRGLTFLFEEARYSDHEISEEKRIMALNHLKSLEHTLSTNVGISR
jgi:hypothetical protein